MKNPKQKRMTTELPQKTEPAVRPSLPAESSRVLSVIRAVLDEKEREQVSTLVEREKWVKRLAF